MRPAWLILACAVLPSAAAQRVPINSEWQLFRYGAAGDEAGVVSVNPPTVRFNVGRIVGHGGCSVFSGGYLVRDSELRIGSLNVTPGPCLTRDLRNLEGYVLNALPQVKRFQITDGFLVLFTTDRQALVFRRLE